MNRKYHVYGLGNALVDMEFEVSPELLKTLNIDKGVMTLMDEDRQHEIINHLSDFHSKKSCGGSAANTMVAISQFGGKSFYSCKVAHDEMGAFYLEDLMSYGVDTNLKNRDTQEGITGKCLVLVTPDADRTMNTFLGITANFSPNELVSEAIEDSQYLYIEGYLVSSPTGKEAAIKAREIAQAAGVKTTLSLSDYNMTKFFNDGLLEIIGSGLDFIFANESEALEMANTDQIDLAIDYLKGLSQGFAITRGAKGSVIFDGEKLIEIEANLVHAVDTVGAGDMYAGAFLYGITHGMSFAESGKLASMSASKIVTVFGPRLTTAEVEQIKLNI
jgi:sugar/nucleoside kinase (ribokinase family)